MIIGQEQPFFRYDKEFDPFKTKEKECPFYYLIELEENNQLEYTIFEAITGKKTLIHHTDIIRNKSSINKLTVKHPLYKKLKRAIELREYDLVRGKAENVAFDMISKLYQELTKLIDYELESYIQQRKDEDVYKQKQELKNRISPDILEEIKADPIKAINKACECVGIIRETKNKIALYLSGILGNTAGMIYIAGNTSTGKSHLMNNVLKLYPESYVFDVSSFSDKSPLYLFSDNEELQEAEIWSLHETINLSSDYRDMFMRLATNEEDREFTYTTVDKNFSGRNVSRILTFPKVSFWTTMTLGEINSENINRGIVVSVEESQTKIEEILKYEAQYDAIGGKPDLTEYTETFKAWSLELIEKRRQIQGWICPFFNQEMLKVPISNPSIIRHWKKIRRYAFAFALINERPVINTKDKKLIIIEPADILLTLELFKEILTETISEIDKRYRIFYNDVLEDLQESDLGYTTIKRMDKKREDLAKPTVRQYLKTLCTKNYLTYEKDPSDKKTYHYTLTSQSLDSPIEFNYSKVIDTWRENYSNLTKEIQKNTERFFPEYKNGDILLKNMENLYFLDQLIVDTEQHRTYRKFSIKPKKLQTTMEKTTKEIIQKTRTQNKYKENEQKVWHTCCLITYIDEEENFTANQVYNKLKKEDIELDEYTVELVLMKLAREGFVTNLGNEKFELTKKVKEEPILQDIIEACKNLDEIHKGSFCFSDLKKYLIIKEFKLNEESLENILSKLVQDGIMYNPTANRFSIVKGG